MPVVVAVTIVIVVTVVADVGLRRRDGGDTEKRRSCEPRGHKPAIEL
jgi:hypothetical protein